LAWATILQGWALTAQHQDATGIAQMRQGLAALQATGGEARLPYYLALLAEAHARAGQTDEGLTVVSDALSHLRARGEGVDGGGLHRSPGCPPRPAGQGTGADARANRRSLLTSGLKHSAAPAQHDPGSSRRYELEPPVAEPEQAHRGP